MKKRLGILIILFIGIFIGIYYLKNTNNKKDIIDNKTNNSYTDNLLVMVQDEENKYIPWESEEWPPIDKYKFNENLSKCENGSTITWKEETNSVILKANTSDRCSAYFDIDERTAIEKNISRLVNLSKDMDTLEKDTEYNNKSYKGELVHHDGSIKGEDGTVLDAEDNGYRYSGDNPNNFVCFGPGAEGYSKGTSKTCDAKNLYRIIGIVPVDVVTSISEDGTETIVKQNLIKLIQSEYATASQLGKEQKDGKTYVDENNALLKRIKEDVHNLDGFHWNEKNNTWIIDDTTYYNYWEKNGQKSTLNQALNEGYFKYLDNSKKEEDNQKGLNWTEKIATVKWNIGGGKDSPYIQGKTPKIAYNNEITNTPENLASFQIGLIYVHDFCFASDKENWNKLLNCSLEDDNKCYWGDSNRENNWLFNGVFEWTIMRHSNNSDRAFRIGNNGSPNDNTIMDVSFAIRPTFYLKPNEVFIKGNGTAKTPYALNID